MFSRQHRFHLLFPILSILLVVVLPSFGQNDQLNAYSNEYQQQSKQRSAPSDSSVSSSEISFDTKNFEDDTVPSAFNWDSPGVSTIIDFCIIVNS